MSDAGKSIYLGQELSHDLYLELDTHLQEFGLNALALSIINIDPSHAYKDLLTS